MYHEDEINLQEERLERVMEKCFHKALPMERFYEELLKSQLYFIADVREEAKVDLLSTLKNDS